MRAFCPVCGGPYALRRDGAVRGHQRFEAGGRYGSGPRTVRCEGSGRKPERLIDDKPAIMASMNSRTKGKTMQTKITATVEQLPNGKYLHRVFEDGLEVTTRTSAKRYGFINVQRWPSDDWAPRYASKPAAPGSRIEYGYCAETVEVLDAPEPCPACGRLDCTPNRCSQAEAGKRPTVMGASATLAEKAEVHERLAALAALDALIDQHQQSDARLRML